MKAILSTGFSEIDRCIGGGFQQYTSTLIVAPPNFGNNEYAHYLVQLASAHDVTTAVVTSDPDAAPDLLAFADIVIKVDKEFDYPAQQAAAELEAVPVDLVVVVDVMDELAVYLADRGRRFSTMVLFASSNAGPYDERRPLREAYTTCEVVLNGSTYRTVSGEFDPCWTISKNKFGAVGVGAMAHQRKELK